MHPLFFLALESAEREQVTITPYAAPIPGIRGDSCTAMAKPGTVRSSTQAAGLGLYIHYKMNKCQLCDGGFRPSSSLQAAWDTSIARTTGFM